MKLIKLSAIFLGLILVSGTVSTQAFADVISPRAQMHLDFTTEQIICGEGLVKVIKKTTGNASCVKPATAEKLAEAGWSNSLSEKKIEEIKEKLNKKGDPAGTITKISTVKQLSKTVKAGNPSSVSGYVYVFDACATSKTIRTPEIYVTSDSETKSVKLGGMLKPESCYTSSVMIKAADPNSISATLLNKGGISEKISSLESQISDLKDRISAAKQKIPKTGDEPNPENLSNITSMKKELKSLQDQLRRYLMVLYVPPSVKASKIDIPKSITGQPLEGMTTNLISVTESIAKPESGNVDLKRFNVVFEACTGSAAVRMPIITISSDTESVDVKLIERIIPESCQVGIGKINAVDSESIMTKISGNSGISKQISSLEKLIEEKQTQLADRKSKMGLLFAKQLDANGQQVAENLAYEISELRSELLESRAKLYGLMLGK